jgi:hypothetical protein
MGLFREAGRQVEQLKQSVTEHAADAEADDTDSDDAAYECASCSARFDTHDGECPECWSEEVRRLAE